MLRKPLLRAAGSPVEARIELSPDPDRIDHVWLVLDVGLSWTVRVSVNTWSRRNAEGGFDPRIRVGFRNGDWEVLPPRGLQAMERFDYQAEPGVRFRPVNRPKLEEILLDCAERARLIEAWGAPYWRKGFGIHQVHSRKRSCVVDEDLRGHDGGLKFYFEHGKQWRLLLMKFCGQ